MSNSTVNETVSHNLYFEGKVQSLGLETQKGKATVGVMKPGAYTFSASAPEKMIIISGTLEVNLNGNEFVSYTDQQEFEVPAGTSFNVKCNADVAYLCYYG